jgi:hypothetical protein
MALVRPPCNEYYDGWNGCLRLVRSGFRGRTRRQAFAGHNSACKVPLPSPNSVCHQSSRRARHRRSWGSACLGHRRFFRCTSKAGRWSGCPFGGMRGTGSGVGSGCGRCGGGCRSRQIGETASRLLIAKHQHNAGGCPSLYNECLRAFTAKPKIPAGYGPHPKCADV